MRIRRRPQRTRRPSRSAAAPSVGTGIHLVLTVIKVVSQFKTNCHSSSKET